MAVAYILLLLLLLAGARWHPNGFRGDFLGKEQCAGIKGAAILAIFISHALIFLSGQGFSPTHALDAAAVRVQASLSQLVVVVFLFYSGYGVMESIKARGADYIASFPRKRLLATLLNFDVAVLVCIVLDRVLGTAVSPVQAVLALLAWTTVGLHNWYIFVILSCYAATWAAFRLFPGRRTAAAGLVAALLLGLQLALSVLKSGQHWWYDTILCYPAGLLFSLHKEKAVAFCQRRYGVVLAGLAAAFAFLANQTFLPDCRGLTYNLESIVFALLVVQTTMKLAVDNRVLAWFGNHLFPFFVYHQLPMMVIGGIAGSGWIVAHPYGFAALSFAAACAIAHFHEYWWIKL